MFTSRLSASAIFYKSLFDLKWSREKVEQDNKRRTEKISVPQLEIEEEQALERLTHQANISLQSSAFHTVDFAQLFMMPEPVGSPGGIA